MPVNGPISRKNGRAANCNSRPAFFLQAIVKTGRQPPLVRLTLAHKLAADVCRKTLQIPAGALQHHFDETVFRRVRLQMFFINTIMAMRQAAAQITSHPLFQSWRQAAMQPVRLALLHRILQAAMRRIQYRAYRLLQRLLQPRQLRQPEQGKSLAARLAATGILQGWPRKGKTPQRVLRVQLCADLRDIAVDIHLYRIHTQGKGLSVQTAAQMVFQRQRQPADIVAGLHHAAQRVAAQAEAVLQRSQRVADARRRVGIHRVRQYKFKFVGKVFKQESLFVQAIFGSLSGQHRAVCRQHIECR